MTEMRIKFVLAMILGVCVLALLGWNLASLGAPAKVVRTTKPTSAPSRPMVLTHLAGDPFYHPALAAAPEGVTPPPPIPAVQTGPGSQPDRRPPGQMPGVFPSYPIAVRPLQPPLPDVQDSAGTPLPASSPPSYPPIRLLLRGLVGGDSPVAFLSVDGAPSATYRPGDSPGPGLTISAITETALTLTGRGKKLTLRPGQEEPL
jgi:hypothetical protein